MYLSVQKPVSSGPFWVGEGQRTFTVIVTVCHELSAAWTCRILINWTLATSPKTLIKDLCVVATERSGPLVALTAAFSVDVAIAIKQKLV